MATTGSNPLNLTKPEANDVVDLSVINTNYDTINTFAANTNTDLATKAGQISTLNTAVGAAGTVQNAVKATNVAGGAVNRIPIQSAANTTTFINAPASGGKILYSSLSAPGAVWSDPIPYRIQSGVIPSASWSSGTVSITFNTAFDTGIVPIVILSPISSNASLITSATLTSTPTATGFSATARSYNGTSFANASPTTHWVAIQYFYNQAGS